MTEPDTFPVEDARKKFADILDGTQFRSTHAQITRRGKRAGYVVPPEWYDRAVEALARVQASAAEEPAQRPSPAVTTPRQQVTQSLPKVVPAISAKVRALPAARVKELADRAQDRYPEWVEEIEQEYPHLRGADLDYLIVDLGLQKGFKIPDLTESSKIEGTDRPISEEEAAVFATRARECANEMQLAKLEQLAGFAAEGSKDFAVMHAALDMGLLTHDEVYGTAPVRPAASEETTS